MNLKEREMYHFLTELRDNFHVKGVKISFEDEGLTAELSHIISSIAFRAGVQVSLKIGGCEARRDIYQSKVIGADKLVAPMIESPYALKKFIEAVHGIYTENERAHTKLMINIETINGYRNLADMLQIPEAQELYGIVLGRVDFSCSLGKDRSFVNSKEMLKITTNIAKIAQHHDKKFFIGGSVSPAALDFCRSLPTKSLECIETRNIIFGRKALDLPNIQEGLIKAMGFELAWMQCKSSFYGALSNAESKRIEMIEKRYTQSLEQLHK